MRGNKEKVTATMHPFGRVVEELIEATDVSGTEVFLFENPPGLQMNETTEDSTGLQRLFQAIENSERLKKFHVWDFAFDAGCFMEGSRNRLFLCCRY